MYWQGDLSVAYGLGPSICVCVCVCVCVSLECSGAEEGGMGDHGLREDFG